MERVLVIDDDVGLCELVEEYLGPEGYEVEATHNGERGIDRALSNDHSLVILDVMLPGMHGFDVLRRIRAKSPSRKNSSKKYWAANSRPLNAASTCTSATCAKSWGINSTAWSGSKQFAGSATSMPHRAEITLLEALCEVFFSKCLSGFGWG